MPVSFGLQSESPSLKGASSGSQRRIQGYSITLIMLASLLVLILISLRWGAVELTWGQWWQGMTSRGEAMVGAILWELRWPRTLLGVLVGAALGMAGALLQGMLGNGLADPYLLGISAGAGLAAVGLLTWGEWTGWVPLVAWVGGLATTGLVFALAYSPTGLAVERLILAGVAVSALFGALTSSLLLLADERVQVALTWLIGSLSGRGWAEVVRVTPYMGLGLLLGWGQARALNLLGLGEEMAAGLGIPIARTRVLIGAVAALLAATAVSVSGLIGFVGLLVPHMVRRGVGSDYRWVLPLSALGGAVLLVAADWVARLGRVELPVGIVTAVLGAPFFAWLLWRRAA